MLQIESDEPGEDDDCDLPRAALPTRKTARGDEEREPERCDEREADPVHVLGCQRCDQRVTLIRQHCIEHSEQADGGDEPREHERAPRTCGRMRATSERAGQTCERRREVDRLLAGRRMESLMRRHLTHDQQRHAGCQISPSADTEGSISPAVSRSARVARATRPSSSAAAIQTARKTSNGTTERRESSSNGRESGTAGPGSPKCGWIR